MSFNLCVTYLCICLYVCVFTRSTWTSQSLTWIFHTFHKRSHKLDAPASNIGFHGKLNPFYKSGGSSGWSLLWMSGWNLFHSNGRNLFHNSGQNQFQICLEYVSVVPRKGSISEVCASLCLRNLILSYEGKSFKKCGLDLDWNSGFCRTSGRSMQWEKKNVSRWIFFENGRWWCVYWESRSSKSGG